MLSKSIQDKYAHSLDDKCAQSFFNDVLCSDCNFSIYIVFGTYMSSDCFLNVWRASIGTATGVASYSRGSWSEC